MEDFTVKDLMTPDLLSWDSNVIHNLFSAQDTVAILNIPLPTRKLADIRVWHQTTDDNYTVKSAYHRCMSIDAKSEAQTADTQRNWNKIWRQQVPHKVRSFLWRLARTCLPMRTSLIQKGVHCSDACVTYDIMAETHLHTFFICPKALCCWELVHLDNVISKLIYTTHDCTALLFSLSDRLSAQQQSLASMILWSIWKSRNSKLWEGSDTPPSTLVRRAKYSLNECQFMQRAKQTSPGTHSKPKWLKLLPTTMKCNVDCALFNDNTITGYGLCFRDSTGQLVLGMSNYAFFSSSPSEAEALGLLEAIKLVVAHGYQTVTFESDCRFVVNAVNTSQVPLNEVGNIISSCRELLSFQSHFSVKFVRRQTNEVAHSIARASLSYPRPHIFNDVPSYLYHLIMNEMM